MVNEAVVVLTMRARDEASPQINNVGASAANMGTAFRQALPSLASFGSSMTSLLIITGALNNSTGRWITTTLAVASATASAIPAMTATVKILRSLTLATKAQAVAQSVLLGLSGIGLPLVAAGLAAGAATAAGLIVLEKRSQKASPAVNLQAAPGAAPITIINQGVMMGNEQDAERLAADIRRRNRQAERLGE